MRTDKCKTRGRTTTWKGSMTPDEAAQLLKDADAPTNALLSLERPNILALDYDETISETPWVGLLIRQTSDYKIASIDMGSAIRMADRHADDYLTVLTPRAVNQGIIEGNIPPLPWKAD